MPSTAPTSLAGHPPLPVRRARGAVGVLFFVNGALFASLVPRYPDLKAGLGLSNAAFGTAIAAYALGALVVGLLAGALVSRWGSVRVALLAFVGAAANLLLIALAPSWAALALTLFVAGSFDALADVANNAHSLRVERLYRRSILNALHGVWSVGAVVGAVGGGLAAREGMPLEAHLAVVAVLLVTAAAVASRRLLPGPDRVQPTDGRPAAARPGAHRHHLVVARTVVVLGVVAATGQAMEEAGSTWSAVYLRDELGAAAFTASLAYAALQALQTVGRLVADRFVDRHGDRSVARAGAALACAASTGALLVPSALTTVLAFGAVGLGIGTLIPASMRAANAVPALPPGVGLALAASVLRLSGLVTAPVVGLVADATDLRTALVVVPVAALVAVALAPALPRRRAG